MFFSLSFFKALLDIHASIPSIPAIVIATAKRARQIIGGDEPLVENAKGKKPLSIAVEELYTGKVKIMGEDAVSEDNE